MDNHTTWLKGRLINGLLILAMLFLSACSHLGDKKPVHSKSKYKSLIEKAVEGDGPPLEDQDVTHIPNATPKHEPLSRYGNPSTYKVLGSEYHVRAHSLGYQQTGTASWYGRKFHGLKTSSGEPYDMFGMTAAHRELPLPTYAKVKNLDNNREVIVKINDRGPFVKDRLIDLSYAAAKKLGIHATGTAKVEITAINPKDWHKQEKDLKQASKAKTSQLAMAGQPHLRDKPSSKSKPKTTNPSKSSSDQNKQIYIQLGSFSKKQNAQKLATRASTLTKALTPVNVVSNKDLYKVRVGPIKNELEAKKLHKKLLALNNSSAKVIYE
jgi:rare lipoprotein A